ncbi:hypothetical protein ACW2QC_09885 [Virgibacillus sp. FSP13]
MLIMPQGQIKDEKINQLKAGRTAYAESNELIRLIKRDITKLGLHVHCDQTNTGCWFIPLHEQISS